MPSIDLNCDLGESYGRFQIGNDQAVFPFITSCNIACGYHGGDPLTIMRTIELANLHDVVIGAHPSYPDLQGFGRRTMEIPAHELLPMIQYQLGGLMALCTASNTAVKYVKPHGALYNRCSWDRVQCETVARAIHSLDSHLVFMGLAGSIMQDVAEEVGLTFVAEAFIDRRYKADGRLQDRSENGSVITSVEEAVDQVLSIVLNQSVSTVDGGDISLRADSICIHGDNPEVTVLLEAVDQALEQHRVEKLAFV